MKELIQQLFEELSNYKIVVNHNLNGSGRVYKTTYSIEKKNNEDKVE